MKLTFQKGGDIIEVKIHNQNVMFTTAASNFSEYVPLDALKLSTPGIIKEFPDLEGKPPAVIRQEALKRWKIKLSGLGGEVEIKKYVVKELEMQGFQLIMIKREGFRPQKVT